MANLVPKVDNSGTLGTSAKKWANVHATTLTPSAQASALSLNSQKITNLAAPTSANDAATKQYVDQTSQGLDVKASVRVATTANITIATALNVGDSIDGVTLADGDRVLVKDQSTASQNGIYVAGASPARSDDMAASSEAAGVFVFVEEGSTNADNGFVCTTNDSADTVGTHSLTFVQFTGAGQITAGSGLSKTGNILAVDIPGSTEMTGDVADADELLISDGGTLKRADFSVVRDAIFNDISGNATVAAGGALSISSAAITGQTAETSIADDDLILISDTSASGALRKMTKSNFVSGLGGGSLSNVVEDTTPQLGGNLDVNSNAIGAYSGATGHITFMTSPGVANAAVRIINQGQPGKLEIWHNGANYVGLKASSSLNADYDLVLPTSDGSANQVLKTDGSGNLSWTNNTGGISNVVEDTTPQLGGALDVNGKDITSASNGNITLTPNGSGVVRIDGTSGIDIESGSIAVKNSGSVSNIKLYCEVGNAHYTQLQSAAHGSYSGNVTLTLPTSTGTLVGSGDTGTVTNTMLAGSIANAKLSNSAVTVTAGNGLSGGGSVALGATTSLALDLNELTAAVVDVANDSIVIVDANDSNASKKESVADLVAGVAGTGLSASSGQLSIDGTVTTLAGSQTLTNKTLTSPVLNTGVSGTAVLDEDDMNSNSATKLATQQSIKAYVDAQVAGGGLNIDGYSALGGTGVHQTEDHFVFSDNGTEKKITFSNLEDAIFANISGDATIAAGGALTIGANAVEGSMLNNNTISGQTEMTGDVADADELLISDAGTLKRADFSVVRDAVFNDVSGDATIAAGGALTIAATSVENSMLAGSITASKMNNAIFADLETLGAPASDGQFIVATGAGAFAYESANTARTSLGLGTGNSPTFTSLTLSGQAGALAMNSQKITGLATPTADGDAATKSYVDSVAQGLSAKDAVRVATTANGTLSSAFANGQTVDGITLATGDRILIKNQSTGSENGIYTVNASGAPTRAVDFDANAEVAKGAYVFVEEGTTNADAGFVLTTDGAITLGTTSLAFTQFSGAGDITAGSALTKSGNTLNVAVDDSSIEISSDALRVKASGITSAMLAGSIANSKLNAITTANKVALSSLDLDGGTDIGADLADADLIVVDDGAGGTNRKAALSRMKKYVYSSISGDATASDAGALTIAANAVEGSMLNNNAISGQTEMTGDVADTDELMISDAGTLKRADFSVVRDAVFADVSGDATVAAGGALTIASGAVETAMVNANVITGQTAETSIHDDDLVLIYDDSASALRKMTKANFVSGLGGGGLSNIVEDTSPQLGGNLDPNGNAIAGNLLPSAANTYALGSTSAEWSDLYLGDLSVIYFGNDQDTKLTHNPDTGLKFELSSAGLYEPKLELLSNFDGTVGPSLVLNQNSSSPANADRFGRIEFKGNNDAGQNHLICYIDARTVNVSDGSEEAELVFTNSTNGSTWGAGNVIFTGAGLVKARGGFHSYTDTNGITFGADGEITLKHVHNEGLALKHTATGDDKPVKLTLQTGETGITVDEVIGTLDFQAPDVSAGTDAILVCAGIEAVSEGTFSSSNNATKLSFKTAASEVASEKMSLSSTGVLKISGGITPASADGAALGSASAEWSDLYLALGGQILFGNNQKVTVTHEENKGLKLKNVNVGDNNPFTLTLQTGETDIQSDDVIGKIDFQAPDEATGTDAILVCAGIEAVSEGDFSASNNATKLSFKTAASEAASEKMSLSSTGELKISGDLVLDDGGSIKEAGGTAALTIDASGNVTKIGQDSPSSGEFLKWDGSKAVWDSASGGGGSQLPPEVKTVSTTATLSLTPSNASTYNAIEVIYTATGSSAYTVTLPTAASIEGKKIHVKRLATSNITVDGDGSETIDGSATFVLTSQYSSVTLISDGTNWLII